MPGPEQLQLPPPSPPHPGGEGDHHSIALSALDWGVQLDEQMGWACHAPVIQMGTVALRHLTDQPQSFPAPQCNPSRPHSPSFALTLSFCLSPSSSLPLPGFLIHSFPFITETHSCMGEKHLPAAAVWRQTGGGGARRGREPEGEGMKKELGEEWKLRGAAGLGKGLKTANTG